MARRKKEDPQVHRDIIAAAAEQLFLNKGISAATMDDIARNAGYSKATLYVYFHNKNDIVGYLTLKSMQHLLAYVRAAGSGHSDIREQYFAICHGLTDFQQKHPLYFDIILEEINVDFQKDTALEVEKDIYTTGELINKEISFFLKKGIEKGVLKSDLPVLPTVFLFWASLSGIIKIAAQKENYIRQSMGMNREAFLNYCFETLYCSIIKEI